MNAAAADTLVLPACRPPPLTTRSTGIRHAPGMVEQNALHPIQVPVRFRRERLPVAGAECPQRRGVGLQFGGQFHTGNGIQPLGESLEHLFACLPDAARSATLRISRITRSGFPTDKVARYAPPRPPQRAAGVQILPRVSTL